MLGIGEAVFLDISKNLENSCCKLYFDNFFNSAALVAKLFDKGIYCIGTVRTDRKNMAIMKKNNIMKRGDIDFQYAENIVAVKRYGNRGVTLIGTCSEGCNQV